MFTLLSHAGAPYCPTIEHVVTNKVHTLSCVSYDSPPTEVIWERDGERIYFNDTSSDVYHPNQVLLNRTTSAYNNTLTINATIEDVEGNYSCTVLNSVGQSDRLFKTVQGELQLISLCSQWLVITGWGACSASDCFICTYYFVTILPVHMYV